MIEYKELNVIRPAYGQQVVHGNWTCPALSLQNAKWGHLWLVPWILEQYAEALIHTVVRLVLHGCGRREVENPPYCFSDGGDDE